MKVTSNPTHRLSLQPFRANSLVSMLARSKPAAEEQFLEQTPWANPQHPAHQQNPAAANRRTLQSSRPHSPHATLQAPRRSVAGLGSASTIADQHSGPLITPTLSSVERISTDYHSLPTEPLSNHIIAEEARKSTSKVKPSVPGPEKEEVQRESSPIIYSLPLERAASLEQSREPPEIPPRRRTSSPLTTRSPRLTTTSQFMPFGPHLEETMMQARSDSVHIESQLPQQVGIS